MRRQRLLVLAVVLVGAGCGGSEAQDERRESDAAGCRTTVASPRYREAITADRKLVPLLAAGLRAPGLSLAVAVSGRVVWSVECGVSDRRARTPVTGATLFRIGSLSKTLTAAALASYAASGVVDLDAPITAYLPSFRPARGITLRRLAGHLGGIRHYETPSEVVNRRHFEHVPDSLALVAGRPLVASPGTRFAYSTYGYNLIGAALERATGQEFAALVRKAILEPSRLRHTVPATSSPRSASTFYELTDSGGVRLAPPIDLSDRLPGGGFLSTARDLAVFGSRLADGRIVPPATVRAMFRSQTTTGGQPTGYGLGFEIHASPRGLFVGHMGAVDGGTAALIVHVSSGTSLALATNVGVVTAAAPPPPPKSTPDPPRLLLPFLPAGG